MRLSHSGKLDEISKAIKELGFQSSRTKEAPSQDGSFSQKDFDQLADRLLSLVESARDVSFQQRVLRGLYYKMMLVRSQNIAEAHAKTFSWVFKRGKSRELTDTDYVCTFASWLENGHGIYWMSGKAGSGKSTLMKFLGDHPQTSEILSAWAGPQECIIARHYFWSSGTRLQKSIDGLLRSLLYEIFRKVPDLISKTVHKDQILFDLGDDFDPYGEGRAWSMSELGQVVDRLVAHQGIPKRFCFFIDGLDEYDGDHQQVINILGRLASSENVKICVSSRPWNAFQDAYGAGNQDWKLSLQDLTKGDIRRYTQSMLEEHPNWPEYSSKGHSLAQEITDMAQGVFLWVFLVVRSLKDGLTNGDSLSTLGKRVRQLPQDLEGFFKHMLRTVDPFYHCQMGRMFKLALRAQDPLNLMLYSLIDQCNDDENWALDCDITSMDNYEISTRRNQMRRRLDGRCKGLLEIQPSHSDIDYLGPKVNFLHRTVRDFLTTKEITDFLDDAAPDYTASAIIFRAYIGLIKLMPVKRQHFERSRILFDIIDEAFSYAREAELESGHAEVDLVHELRRTVEELANSHGFETPWKATSFLEYTVGKCLMHYLADQFGNTVIASGCYLRNVLIDSTKVCDDDGFDATELVAFFLDRGTDPNLAIVSHPIAQEVQCRYASGTLGTGLQDGLQTFNHAKMKADKKPLWGTLWGDWVIMVSAAMKTAGLDYKWAARQSRILELLVDHGADVNFVMDQNAVVGNFIEALTDLSTYGPDQRLSTVYIDMLEILLQAEVDLNSPYHETTICGDFFRSGKASVFFYRIRARDTKVGQVVDPEMLKLPLASSRLLARIAELFFEHGADPSCISGPDDLAFIGRPELVEPVLRRWREKREVAERSVTKMLQGWLWWPWSGR